MRQYLVVANQTLGGEHLLEVIRQRAAADPSHFFLVVPATPPSEHLTWTEGEARSIAKSRLQEALVRLREADVEVDGRVGDASPLEAIRDALRGAHYDEIILSTLPPGVSRWLKLDLPHRVERAFDLPVVHVVAEMETP
jgi:hypothetical protein